MQKTRVNGNWSAGAEPGDGGGWKIECVKRNPVHSFILHAASMTGPVGRWLSKAKNIFWDQKSAPETNRGVGFVGDDFCT